MLTARVVSAQGIWQLHSMNVLHRDIKAGNILLDGAAGECDDCGHSGNWKICDFGEAKVLEPPYIGAQTLSLKLLKASLWDAGRLFDGQAMCH